MPRSPELPVLTSRGDLAQHVLVQITFGIAIRHRHAVDHVDDFGQQGWGRDGKASVFHVVRIGRTVHSECPQEREDMFGQNVEHLLRLKVFEPRPAEVVVISLPGIFALWEDAILHRLLGTVGLVLFKRMQIIETLDEQQISNLLHDLKWIRNAARPEGVPNLVDFAAYLAVDQLRNSQLPIGGHCLKGCCEPMRIVTKEVSVGGVTCRNL